MNVLAYALAAALLYTPLCYLVIGFFLDIFARGTRPRYVLNTAEHALRIPAGVCVLLLDIVYFGFAGDDRSWWGSIGMAVQTLAVGFAIWANHRNDDDDWFKGAGKRLRRRARSLGRSLVPKVARPLPSPRNV